MARRRPFITPKDALFFSYEAHFYDGRGFDVSHQGLPLDVDHTTLSRWFGEGAIVGLCLAGDNAGRLVGFAGHWEDPQGTYIKFHNRMVKYADFVPALYIGIMRDGEIRDE